MHIKLHHSEHFTVEVDGKPAYNLDEKLVEIEYADLVTLRNNSGLTPGVFYRIIDYVTTVNSEVNIARSVGHAFDIIVQAITSDRLCEDAYAILHEDDEYFANSDLSAWRLKYSLDNDEDKYEWATPSGKGVIYYLKDEHNNECSYDFKNIQFDTGNWTYTFIKESDNSDNSLTNDVFNNKVNYYTDKYYLKKITLVNECNNNIIINSASINITRSNNITITRSYNITIGDNVSNSTIKNSVNVDIYIGCNTISIDESEYITIYGNTSKIVIGKYCKDIIISGNSNDIIIGEWCTGITFLKEYTICIYVEPHVHDVTLTSSKTTSYSNQLRFIKFQSNMYRHGTITHNTINADYFTTYDHNGAQN